MEVADLTRSDPVTLNHIAAGQITYIRGRPASRRPKWSTPEPCQPLRLNSWRASVIVRSQTYRPFVPPGGETPEPVRQEPATLNHFSDMYVR